MKKLSRLTALLLAMIMLFSSVPFAGASSVGDVDYDTYNTWLRQAQEQAAADAVVDAGGEVIVYETEPVGETSPYDNEWTVDVPMNASADTAGTQQLGIANYSKVTLSTTGSNGQWQVLIGGNVWVALAGETASTFEVTFAKLQSIFQMNNTATLRYLQADGQCSDYVVVGMDYTAAAAPAAEELSLESTAGTYALRTAAEPLAEGDEEDPETVSIEIKYLYSNDEPAATSYVAQIEKGGDLITSVIQLPVVTGYKPTFTAVAGVTFVEPAGDNPGSIQLNLKDVTADLVYTVVYMPDFVDYKVEHYLMGFDSEQSTAVLKETETFSNLKTGEAVGEGLANAYEGFSPLWYDATTKVAADSSTVIKIYYERNWYLMLFNLDGGYGVEPIYAQYGAAINVGTPTKAGYSFEGWSATQGGAVTTLPATMPAANTTYYAVWEAATTAKVTVVFWGETANSPYDAKEYAYIGSGSVDATVGSNYKYGNETLACATEAHTHSNACIDCGKEEHGHTIDKCYTLKCTQASHQHSTGCYEGVGEATSHIAAPRNPVNGQIYTWSIGFSSGKSIYINGTWYKYTGNINTNGEIAPAKCGKTESDHVHSIEGGCYTLTCTQEVHSHTAECYGCGKAEHTHDTDCTFNVSEKFPSNLWTMVVSEEKVVLPDGSTIVNVKYDRVKFTLTFKVGSTTVKTINEKWGKLIKNEFPIMGTNGVDYKGVGWSVPQNCETFDYGYELVSIDVMPAENITFTYDDQNADATLYYYVEALPGESNTYPHGDKEYVLYKTVYLSDSVYLTYAEEFHDIEGFTQGDYTPSGIFSSSQGVEAYNYLFYTRNSYALEFYNPTNLLKKESNILYGANLGSYDFTPTADQAPAYYEPGSVRFEGWYLNPDCSGEKYDLSAHTMPAAEEVGGVALSLYANWVLVEHDVTFYTKKEDIAYAEDGSPAGTKLVDTFQVTHYDLVTDVEGVTIPSNEDMKGKNGNYTFVGWFYTDENGEDKAFDPGTMPVVRDLVVFGKWNATEPVTFTIYYKHKYADGTEVDVAAPTVGQALDGTTITAEAKTGDALYPAYRKGYFPKPPSHSVEIDVSKEENTYTFWYAEAEKVPYKVVYLLENEDGTYTVDSEKLVLDNSNVIVTENYKRIAGYMPDAYQKRLIVAYPGTTDDNGNYVTDPDLGENIIFFYYHKDTVNAFWTVSHYVEPIGGVTDDAKWQQYGVTESYMGTIDKPETAIPRDITGFHLAYGDPTSVVKHYADKDSETVYLANAEALTQVLTSGGMDFHLYYVRNEYPVKVQYLEEGTNTELKAAVLYNNGATYDYQLDIKVNAAAEIAGYELVSPVEQPITITVDGVTLETIEKNVVTYYYKKTADITYVAVTDEKGTLTLDDKGNKVTLIEDGTSGLSKTETVYARDDGDAKGATAVANAPTYKFVGWYSDAACTNEISKNATYVPAQNTDKLYESATYYAKFELNAGSLTIEKTVQDSTFTSADEERTFNFTVNDVTKSITVNGANKTGSVTFEGLVIGPYTVTETITGDKTYTTKWSNSETAGLSTEVTIIAGQNTTLEVVNTITENMDITVTKVWDDNSNNLGKRPATLNLTLSGTDGSTRTVTLNKPETGEENVAAQWSATVTVPKFHTDGQLITYTLAEASVPAGYSLESIANETLTVTNSIVAGSLMISKDVSDTLNLYGDAARIFTFTVTGPNGYSTTQTITYTNQKTSLTLGDLLPGTYTVTETKYPGYSTTANGQAGLTATVEVEAGYVVEAAFVNTVVPTNVTVTKEWVDESNALGLRPDSITVDLLADGEVVKDNVEITKPETTDENKTNTWTYTWYNLPEYTAEGVKIVYTATEADVENYSKVEEGLTITNTLTKGRLEIVKTVKDSTFTSGSFTFTAVKDGVTTDITVNVDTTKTGSEIVDLPAGEYVVTETSAAGYATTMNGTTGTSITVTVTAGKQTTVNVVNTANSTCDIQVTKVWEDNNNAMNLRAPVTVHLFANGTELTDKEVTLNGEWTYTWEDLPAFDNEGAEITYTVTEDAVEHYTAGVVTGDKANGFVITNTIEVGSITVTKQVVDALNLYTNSERTFTFTRSGSNESKTITLKANELTDTVTFDKLPAGVYTVIEAPYNGYVTTVDGKETDRATVTVVAGQDSPVTFVNTVVPTDVTVTKIWVDDSNAPGLRPDSITVDLLADGVVVKDNVEITKPEAASDTWTYTWNNLPEYTAKGVKIVYTVEEADVANYAKNIEGLTITNTLRSATLTIIKSGDAEIDGIDNGQSFLFEVVIENGATLTIAINGKGSETIVGLYEGQTVTVTEIEGWSWRYTATNPDRITLKAGANEVTVENTRDHQYWLDGDSYAENVFKANATDAEGQQ